MTFNKDKFIQRKKKECEELYVHGDFDLVWFEQTLNEAIEKSYAQGFNDATSRIKNRIS